MIRFLSFGFCLFWLCTIHAQTNSIFIDFGGTSSPLPWNNISNVNNGSIASLKNNFGIPTNVGLAVVDSFNGINSSGTQSPAFGLNIPSSASGDSFFGNTVAFGGKTEPSGAIQFNNLDTSIAYTLKVFASRLASDNRETQFVLSGSTQDTAYLNVSNNTDSVVIFSSNPTANGTLTLRASKGPNNNNSNGFFYLGVVQLEYPADTILDPELALLRPNGGEFFQVGKIVQIQWESTLVNPSTLWYSSNQGAWKFIDTVGAFIRSYNWMVPNDVSDEVLILVKTDTLQDASNGFFEISDGQDSCLIVVIGSSTAAGSGASTKDSAWVNRYRNSLYLNDTRYPVVNLARGGYTTYHLLPSGNSRADTVGIVIDTTRNVSKALSLNPSGIIVNLPSNDAAYGFSVKDQMINFNLMVQEAAAQDVDVWICTTQPRNFSNQNQIQAQMDARDSIHKVYGDHSIDFWTEVADSTGQINAKYNSGDGVHLNDAGHKLLFERVLKKNIPDSLCDYDTLETAIELHNVDYEFMVFPNPGNGLLNIKLKDQVDGRMQIFNSFGRKVYERKIMDEKDFKILLPSPLPQGMYIIRIETPDGTGRKSLILMRN